jgi:hypothetical protein
MEEKGSSYEEGEGEIQPGSLLDPVYRSGTSVESGGTDGAIFASQQQDGESGLQPEDTDIFFGTWDL